MLASIAMIGASCLHKRGIKLKDVNLNDDTNLVILWSRNRGQVQSELPSKYICDFVDETNSGLRHSRRQNRNRQKKIELALGKSFPKSIEFDRDYNFVTFNIFTHWSFGIVNALSIARMRGSLLLSPSLLSLSLSFSPLGRQWFLFVSFSIEDQSIPRSWWFSITEIRVSSIPEVWSAF